MKTIPSIIQLALLLTLVVFLGATTKPQDAPEPTSNLAKILNDNF